MCLCMRRAPRNADVDISMHLQRFEQIKARKILQQMPANSRFLDVFQVPSHKENTKKTPRNPRNSFSKVATSQVDLRWPAEVFTQPWRAKFRLGTLDGWEVFRWLAERIWKPPKNVDFFKSTLGVLADESPTWQTEFVLQQIDQKQLVYVVFFRKYMQFLDHHTAGPCFSQQSMRLALGSRQKASDWPLKWFPPEFS